MLNGGGTAAAVPPARRRDGSNRSVKCTAASCVFLLSGHLECWYYTQSQNHKIWTEATQSDQPTRTTTTPTLTDIPVTWTICTERNA